MVGNCGGGEYKSRGRLRKGGGREERAATGHREGFQAPPIAPLALPGQPSPLLSSFLQAWSGLRPEQQGGDQSGLKSAGPGGDFITLHGQRSGEPEHKAARLARPPQPLPWEPAAPQIEAPGLPTGVSARARGFPNLPRLPRFRRGQSWVWKGGAQTGHIPPPSSLLLATAMLLPFSHGWAKPDVASLPTCVRGPDKERRQQSTPVPAARSGSRHLLCMDQHWPCRHSWGDQSAGPWPWAEVRTLQ